MSDRLPAHIEVTGLIRRVQSEGGFATVIAKGERDAGTLMVVLTERGAVDRAFERMPGLDGSRSWTCTRQQDPENPADFAEYLARRRARDADLWIVEIDAADGARFLAV